MSKIACIDAKIRANGCEENIDSKHAGLAAVTLAARGSPPATWGERGSLPPVPRFTSSRCSSAQHGTEGILCLYARKKRIIL